MSKLFGRYLVTPTPSAIRDAARLFPKYGDYQEARRHALKLAWWPDSGDAEAGTVVDLDWEWIKGMSQSRTDELRISDCIGGHNNLRVIFFVSDRRLPDDPIMRIWTIAVLQKKSMGFTQRDLTVFSARLKIVLSRNYPSR